MIDENDLSFNERENQYFQTIRQIPPGVSQVIIHPGYDDEELNRLTGNGKFRNDDRVIFSDSKIKKLIGEEKINLINWKEFTSLI